ncbi:MAG: hypothetical protein R3A10_07715 [Caldilineaceae bacterium]
MRYLATFIFCTGAATLGMELSALPTVEPARQQPDRLGRTHRADSLYLALGAWLGGVLADSIRSAARLT